jgi:hypothetical protein
VQCTPACMEEVKGPTAETGLQHNIMAVWRDQVRQTRQCIAQLVKTASHCLEPYASAPKQPQVHPRSPAMRMSARWSAWPTNWATKRSNSHNQCLPTIHTIVHTSSLKHPLSALTLMLVHLISGGIPSPQAPTSYQMRMTCT